MNHVRITFKDIEYIANLQVRNEFDAILLIFLINVEFLMS